MDNSLKKFISKYVTLTETELEDIACRFKSKQVKKNDYLLKPSVDCQL